MQTTATAAPVASRSAELAHPRDNAWQAYQLLHWGFVITPLVAGLDKLFHFMTDWDAYLSKYVSDLIARGGLSVHNFMLGVGAIEIVLAMLVAFKPRVGAYLVALWLAGIIANLILLQGFYDIILRDFGLFLAAIALGRLSHKCSR